MKKQHIIATVIISLLVIGGVIVFSGCASNISAEPKGGMEAQVNTAVAATLMQYSIETKVATQSLAMVSEPVAQATEPPVPTPTPVPTEPAQPTAAAAVEVAQVTATAPPAPTAPPATAAPAAASGPSITADQNTNCRVGPDTGYAVETYFMEGSVSTVEGKDNGNDWWYIVSPEAANDFCWVWEGSTTVVGDTSAVPVVAAPAGPKPKASNNYYTCNAYYPYSCVNYPYNNCGKTVCCGQYVTCKPNKQYCYPNKWETCYPYGNCTCKPVYQNTCKPAKCPAITSVNYKNYCNNYPKCCY